MTDPRGPRRDDRPPARSRAPRIARIGGVDVRVHWTFVVLIVFVLWAESSAGTAAELMWMAWIAVVFGSVLVHELAHCLVAKHHGVVVEDILLIPLGGISQMEAIPEEPRDEFAIAVVGPLTSFALAGTVAVGAALFGVRPWPPALFAGSWATRTVWLNVLLGAFNLIPALPMDGGRVLRAALALRTDRPTATRLATRVARDIAIGMIVVGFLYDFWLVLIGCFVLLGLPTEGRVGTTPGRDRDAGSRGRG